MRMPSGVTLSRPAPLALLGTAPAAAQQSRKVSRQGPRDPGGGRDSPAEYGSVSGSGQVALLEKRLAQEKDRCHGGQR